MTGEYVGMSKLFIAYSAKDEALYKELETHLQELKASGYLHSWFERKIIGEKWDGIISDKLVSDIVLLLVSPNFLATPYIHESEVKEAVKLHLEGKLELIPVLLRETDLGGTPIAELETLPPQGMSVTSPNWENKNQAFGMVTEGLRIALKKIINPTEDLFMQGEKKPFPNCIKQFAIKNFQCIRKANLDEIPVDAQWVFITGDNGDGKTALLQALALGLLGNEDKEANHLLKDDSTRIEIEFKHNKHDQINRFYKEKEQWTLKKNGNEKNAPFKLLGYGVTRLNIMTREAESQNAEKNPAYSLYNETQGDFRNIETWLKDNSSKDSNTEPPLVTDVKNLLIGLLPNIDSIDIKYKADIKDKTVVYHEKGFEAGYLQVSSAGKMIIAMIGDMVKRFINAQPGVEKVADFEGLVLIDEFDLHLHPKWQKKLPGLLSRVFPKIQFWVTTHSIVPFMGAPLNSVFLTLNRTKEMGTTVEKLDIDVKNLLPNTLISSPLFGIEDFISSQADDFRTEYLYEEVLKNKELHRKLEEMAEKIDLPPSFIYKKKGEP
jgi:predicted ATP-binding protein involved in virulence